MWCKNVECDDRRWRSFSLIQWMHLARARHSSSSAHTFFCFFFTLYNDAAHFYAVNCSCRGELCEKKTESTHTCVRFHSLVIPVARRQKRFEKKKEKRPTTTTDDGRMMKSGVKRVAQCVCQKRYDMMTCLSREKECACLYTKSFATGKLRARDDY